MYVFPLVQAVAGPLSSEHTNVTDVPVPVVEVHVNVAVVDVVGFVGPEVTVVIG